VSRAEREAHPIFDGLLFVGPGTEHPDELAALLALTKDTPLNPQTVTVTTQKD
jgi:hypothetical protein